MIIHDVCKWHSISLENILQDVNWCKHIFNSNPAGRHKIWSAINQKTHQCQWHFPGIPVPWLSLHLPHIIRCGKVWSVGQRLPLYRSVAACTAGHCWWFRDFQTQRIQRSTCFNLALGILGLNPPLEIYWTRNNLASSTSVGAFLQVAGTCSVQIWRSKTQHTGVSINGGTSKSSIFMAFSIINHPFWGTTIYRNPHISIASGWPC